MIDFILRFKASTATASLSKLADEIERLLQLHDLQIDPSDDLGDGRLDAIQDTSLRIRLNRALGTLDKHKDLYPFFNRYLERPANRGNASPRFADLFAGCGGLSLGLERAGFSLAFVNELESEIAETHYFNHGLDSNYYSVGDIDILLEAGHQILSPRSDLFLVAGGPPCQGFSTANRQRLIDDPRNHLYKSYLRFLEITRPKWFLIENVRGMAQKQREIIEDINRLLGEDYKCASAILNAKEFGIPQNRERFFLIGTRTKVTPESVFTLLLQKRRQPYSLWDAIGDLPPLEPKRIKNDNSIENTKFGLTMALSRFTHTPYGEFINGGKGATYLFNHKNRYNNDRDIEIFTRLPQGADSLHESIADIMPYGRRNTIFKDKYYRLREDTPCKTITAHMKFDCNMYIHPRQPRGLSPREAARVQTFPDDFFFRGSQNGWYKQVGNAVPVRLAQLIGESLLEVAV